MSHVTFKSGNTRSLDTPATSAKPLTEEDVREVPTLVRILRDLLESVGVLRRYWRPRVIDHLDVTVDATGSTVYRFPHGFGTRVNWWPIDFSGGSYGPALMRDPSSDENTLCLVSNEGGVVSIRIEETQ